MLPHDATSRTSLGNYACSYEGRRVKTVGAKEGGATKTADQGNPETKSAALDSIFVFESGKNAADKTAQTASTMRPRRLAESFTTLTVRFDHTYARHAHAFYYVECGGALMGGSKREESQREYDVHHHTDESKAARS